MLLPKPSDPRPNSGDLLLSDQVELIVADNDQPSNHEADINAFLTSLRDDVNHVAIIRSVDTQLLKMAGNGRIDAVTTITYRLIGTIDPPYIP